VILNNIAGIRDTQGDREGTEAILRERLIFARRSWPRGSWRIGAAAMALAGYILEEERYAEAEPYLREAVTSYSESLRPDHGWTANAESILGATLGRLGKSEEGEPLLLRGYQNLVGERGATDSWTLDSLRRLVEFYDLQGRTSDAARYRAMIPAGG